MVAKALGAKAYRDIWPDFEQFIERYAVHVAPMPAKGLQWCAMVVRSRPGVIFPDGPWQEGATPRIAVGRAVVAARYGLEVARN